jgi:hypothetical protein
VKRLVGIIILALLGSLPAWGQATAISWQSINQFGQPIPFAKVRICSVTSTGVPCTPTTPIFLDYAMTVLAANPYTTDQYGNFTVYGPQLPAPNLYVVQLAPTSGVTWSYVFNGVNPGGSGTGCVPTGVTGYILLNGGGGNCVNANADYGITTSGTFTFGTSGTANVAINGTLGVSGNTSLAANLYLTSLSADTGDYLKLGSGGQVLPAAPPVTGVTSVGLALPASVFNVLGSPVTSTGTLSGVLINQNANTVFAGPSSGPPGVPTFRALTSSDIAITLPVFETNSASNTSQALLNFTNTPSVMWSNPSGGVEEATVIVGGNLQMAVSGSPATQFVIVRPSSGSGTCPSGTVCIVGSSSAYLTWACTGVLCNLVPHTQASWVFTGSVLPPGVSAGSVTAVYAYSINSAAPSGTPISSTLTCNGQNVEGGSSTWKQAQGTSAALSGITGSNFTGVTCAADLISGGAPGPAGLVMNVPDIGLIIQYTGAPASTPMMTLVQTPLFYNPSITTLGIDTTSFQTALTLTTTGSSGPATLSGSTLNIPQYAGGTTTNALTMNSSGSGASSGTTFNGSSAVTLSYNTLGAPGISGTPTTGHCVDWASSNTLGDTGSACGSGGGGGLTSLNSLTGPALNLTSTGATITITPSGTNINLEAVGGGGSGVQYNPTSTTYTVTGSSINGDDSHILGPTITVTGGSASGGVCTVTNSGTNGLAVGDWVYTAGITGWPAQGAAFGVYTYGSNTVNDDQFQVISSGLTTTQFKFNCPNAGTATFTGGSAYPSNFWFTHLVEKTPFFNGHGTVNAIFDSTHTCTGINTNFSTLFPNISGHIGYFILTDCHNEFNTGVSAVATQAIINSIMAKAHTAGYVFVLGTTPNAQIASLNNGSYSFALNSTNWWSYTQGKSSANASSGQYADYLADFNAPLSDYQLTGGNNAGIGSAAGNPDAAAILNEALATQNWSPKTQTPFCYFGWYTGVLANASGPGYVCSPSTTVDAFVITDATQTNVGLHVDTFGTIGIREPNDTVATALNLSYIGSSSNLLCTTTNGKVVNSGCAGMTSISSPDGSININTPSGTPTLQLSRDLAYTFDNTHTYLAPTTTTPAAVFQATGVTRPTILQSASGYNGSVTWTTVAGDGIVAFCQNSGSVGSTSSGDTFHVIQNTSTMTLSYAFNIAGGSGVTVGCAGGTGFIVYELANVPTTAFLDASSATTVTSSPQTVSLTTTQSNDLLLSGIIAYFTGLGTQSVNGTWTNGLGGLQGEAVAFQNTTLAGAAGTYPVTWTYSGGTYQVILSAAFKGATASQSSAIVPFKNAAGTVVSQINLSGYMQTIATVFSTLPSCVSGLEGTVAAVTDSTTNTYGATITGSGSNHVPAYCNGTNWIVY